ncbi:prepilin-type N-terminal cleavage/methylation domain-containing protein [Halomonas alkaliantarctica]|uniref:Prepilin-type N-terminal cleavage/methylation domain-containing protein n=1 Tax=Halomonas alkaliantarctica TaxID=232346 RepID=A0ABY8LMR4_9GAMM|nr:prepilin-type N-terminal cleavage/methylation domain-containing protein [Halomonas alkaliantarctica]WGI24874.1 prepilin-type N-terminal cleavage/methylation domain-containing protein [Halomonas alkaliantarctica]
MSQRQHGFTLVELMVAMAIGTVIILGAGQLFLTTFKTFKTVDQVSRKQEALIFAVSTLTEAGRKGNIGNYAIVPDERNSEGIARHYCVLQDLSQGQPIVDLAQVDQATDCPMLSEFNEDDTSHLVTLAVGDCREEKRAMCDVITIFVTERNKVIASQETTL